MYPLLTTLKKALPSAEYAALSAWVDTFYPFQKGWLLEPSRFAICNKSRQIGISHSSAGWAVIRAAFLGETTTVISVGERESFEVLETARKHAGVLSALGSLWASAKPKGEALNFTSGGRVVALPASSGGRSYSGNVFLDEFAFHEGRAERVWDGASAVVTHGYCLRVNSTPNGVGNLFHSLWSDPKAAEGYARHEIPIRAAIADGFPVDLDDCWKMAHGDPRVFAQLFECSFLDGAEQYIPTALITGAIDPTAPPQMVARYAGLDVGLSNDLSVLQVVGIDASGAVWDLDRQDWKRTAWDEQRAKIDESFRTHRWERLCVDATGLGAVPAQQLVQKFGQQRVIPVHFSVPVKESLATKMFQAFADKRMRLRNDRALVQDLSSLRRIVTSTGAVKYDAERTNAGHADRAWALALSLYGMPGAAQKRTIPTGLVA